MNGVPGSKYECLDCSWKDHEQLEKYGKGTKGEMNVWELDYIALIMAGT